MDETRFWRDDALPFVESRRACEARTCYRPHSHPWHSIGAVDAGASLFSAAGHVPKRLGPGSVILIPADCLHACNPLPGLAWSYQMLHLDVDWVQAVLGREDRAASAHAARVPAAGAASGGTGQPASSEIPEPALPHVRGAFSGGMVRVHTDPAVYRQFCELNACLFSTAGVEDKQAQLRAFVRMLDAVPGAALRVPQVSGVSGGLLQPVLACLRQWPERRVALAELAALVGMDRYQLIRSFRAATGLPPHAWLLNQRINRARERLRAGAALASVAQELGFADQAHFQRVFKARAGVSPGRYRAQRCGR